MRRTRMLAAGVGIAVLSLGAWSPAAASPLKPKPRARILELHASDYSFDGPAQVPAGPTRIRLHNMGAEPHQAALVRLAEGVNTANYIGALAQGLSTAASKGTFVAGPNAAAPGAKAEVVVRLEPGQYALLCLIPSPDGLPHVLKGMTRDLTVTPANVTPSKQPKNKAPVLELLDFHFNVPKGLGEKPVKVANRGKQPHEVVVAKLAPGKTIGDIIDWERPIGVPAPGPAPFEFVAGATVIAPGGKAWLELRLPKGDYVLLCFVPDDASGKSHLSLGMVHPFTVA